MNPITIIKPIDPSEVSIAQKPKAAGNAATSFGKFLSNSIEEVNKAQLKGDESATKLATGQQKDIHTTMVTLKKAEISFDLIMQIRNKIVTAYEEIKRMPM